MEPALAREAGCEGGGRGVPMKDDEQLSTILEPDIMVPEQFFAGPRRGEERGEHRLMAAILDDAVLTYCMSQVARARAGWRADRRLVLTGARRARFATDAGTNAGSARERPGGRAKLPRRNVAGACGRPAVRWRDGSAHARHRLVGDTARARRRLASDPAQRAQRLPRFPAPDDDLVGAGAGHALQRRVPSDARQPQASGGPGATRTRVLARHLERHRTDARGRALAGQG